MRRVLNVAGEEDKDSASILEEHIRLSTDISIRILEMCICARIVRKPSLLRWITIVRDTILRIALRLPKLMHNTTQRKKRQRAN